MKGANSEHKGNQGEALRKQQAAQRGDRDTDEVAAAVGEGERKLPKYIYGLIESALERNVVVRRGAPFSLGTLPRSARRG